MWRLFRVRASLRSCFVLFVPICCLFGWVRHEYDAYASRMATVAELYDDDEYATCDGTDGPVFFVAPSGKAPLLRWLREDDRTKDIVGVYSSASMDFQRFAVFPKLSELTVWGAGRSDLVHIVRLPHLRRLDVGGLDTVSSISLSPLSELTSLEHLRLSGVGVTDLAPLSTLGHLEYLDVSGTRVSDLGPIAGMLHLKYLNVAHTEVSDLTPIHALRLVELNISETAVSSVEPLRSMGSLECLTFTGVVDVSPVASADKLPSYEPGDVVRLWIDRSRTKSTE